MFAKKHRKWWLIGLIVLVCVYFYTQILNVVSPIVAKIQAVLPGSGSTGTPTGTA
jgi:hypothetical protein